MKKILTILTALATWCGSAWAEGLTVQDISIAKGNEATLEIVLNNPTTEFAAFQFNVELADGITVPTNDKGKLIFKKGDRLDDDFTLSMSKPNSAENIYRVLGFYTETQAIPGTGGTIVKLTLKADEQLEVGTVCQCKLSAINLTEPNETKHTPDQFYFTVTIVEHPVATYTLTYTVDGQLYKTFSVEFGAAITPESAPTKEGYTFSGWSDIPEIMPEKDVTVTATFYLYGDVNTDTKVNVVDVVDIARYVVAIPSENFREKLADLNNDQSVNIADAVVLVNHIAGDQYFAKAARPKGSLHERESCGLRLLDSEDNGLSLSLTDNTDFTAFQFEVDVPEGVVISAMNINSQRKDGHLLFFNKVKNGRYRVATLSLANAVFKGNEGELLNISLEGTETDDVCIHDIHFVTANGTDVLFDSIRLEGTVTGVPSSDDEEQANDNVFDLGGRKLTRLQKGMNIVGNKKVLVQ